MKRLVVILLVLFFASPVFADADPLQISADAGCKHVTMCAAETDVGICKRDVDGSDVEIVLDVMGRSGMTFFSLQSTASAYSCDVLASDRGFDEGAGVAVTINATSLTESSKTITLSGPMLKLWMLCTAITGGNVTVTAVVCSGNS